MKKNIIKILLCSMVLSLSSCEDMVEGVNENPNDISVLDVENKLFLTGAMLANVQVQLGHLNRISGMYSGQLIGFSSLYSNIYGFNLSTVESNDEWTQLYGGVITNMRQIANNSTSNLLVGIAKVVEAHAIGTGASLWGNIPYSESNNIDVSDPVFDSQKAVYTAAIALLDEGINKLSSASSFNLSQDIYFSGDKDKWIKAANTLKARFYLHQKDYSSALSAASNGISASSGDMKYKPRGAASQASGDKNLFWTILEGSRAGDIGNSSGGSDSYLLQLLDASSSVSRNHAKTNEAARHAYYKIDASGGKVNKGIVEQFEPQNMVTYFENQLIKAECAARSGGVAAGLSHLNAVRSWLNSGGQLNSSFAGMTYKYDAFVAADFDNGGVENGDNVDSKTAFLREVMEERYVSGFGMHMPFNDARRLRKSGSSFAVPFVLVDGPNPPYPERMPYSANELNSNSNAPADPGIFAKTEVNN